MEHDVLAFPMRIDFRTCTWLAPDMHRVIAVSILRSSKMAYTAEISGHETQMSTPARPQVYTKNNRSPLTPPGQASTLYDSRAPRLGDLAPIVGEPTSEIRTLPSSIYPLSMPSILCLLLSLRPQVSIDDVRVLHMTQVPRRSAPATRPWGISNHAVTFSLFR
jgi:hypothetical protein